MVETNTGSDRSARIGYKDVLATDSHPVQAVLNTDSPLPPDPTVVGAKVYYSRDAAYEFEIQLLEF